MKGSRERNNAGLSILCHISSIGERAKKGELTFDPKCNLKILQECLVFIFSLLSMNKQNLTWIFVVKITQEIQVSSSEFPD